MSAVARITVHHEGAGVPTDQPRGADGGYSYWVGSTTWTRLRPPELSYATLGFNHVSLDICLSGNRMVQPVTDNDIAMIRAVCADARNRDELTDMPDVVAHRDSPGSSTVCPGDRTIERWAEIIGACRTPVLTGKVKPMYEPPLGPIAAVWRDESGKVIAAVSPDGAVYAWGCPYKGGANGQDYFAGKRAAQIRAWKDGDPKVNNRAGTYVVVSTSGHKYAY
jgi:hypothetical protein